MRVALSAGAVTGAVAGAVAVLAAGCGSAGAPQGASGAGSQTQRVPATRTVDEHASGTTVTLRQGDRLRVVLHSTYWRIPAPSDPAVLAPAGPQQVVTARPGSCPPGTGCGQVVESFRAVAPGRATVTASRDSCGEAMRCTAGAGSYTVQVVVSG